MSAKTGALVLLLVLVARYYARLASLALCLAIVGRSTQLLFQPGAPEALEQQQPSLDYVVGGLVGRGSQMGAKQHTNCRALGALRVLLTLSRFRRPFSRLSITINMHDRDVVAVSAHAWESRAAAAAAPAVVTIVLIVAVVAMDVCSSYTTRSNLNQVKHPQHHLIERHTVCCFA